MDLSEQNRKIALGAFTDIINSNNIELQPYHKAMLHTAAQGGNITMYQLRVLSKLVQADRCEGYKNKIREGDKVYDRLQDAAELDRILFNEMDDALNEITQCHMYNSGELQRLVNVSAYGIVTGGGGGDALEKRMCKLQPIYKAWRGYISKLNPSYRKIVDNIVFNAYGLERAGRDACLIESKSKSIKDQARNIIMDALNEYCILRGWGDVIRKHEERYIGSLYAIGAVGSAGRVKIGFSTNVKRRLRDLNAGSPVELEIKFHATLDTTMVKKKNAENILHDSAGRSGWHDGVEISWLRNIVHDLY